VPAKFRVRITRTAERDLEEAWTFIAQDSPEEAERFVASVETQIESLEAFPNDALSFPKTKFWELAIDTWSTATFVPCFESPAKCLRFARHSWRKTSGHFNVLGLENRNPHNAE